MAYMKESYLTEVETYGVGNSRWDYELQDSDETWIKEREEELDELTNSRRNKAHGEEG